MPNGERQLQALNNRRDGERGQGSPLSVPVILAPRPFPEPILVAARLGLAPTCTSLSRFPGSA